MTIIKKKFKSLYKFIIYNAFKLIYGKIDTSSKFYSHNDIIIKKQIIKKFRIQIKKNT